MTEATANVAARYHKRFLLLGLALITTVVLTGPNAGAQEGPAAAGSKSAPEAGYVVIQSQPVELSTNVAGRVVAYNTAEIRPQVGGIVKERVFKEGSEVKAGDILYRLDAESYEAALASAEATLKKNEAAARNAKLSFDRYESLVKTSAVSQKDRDDAETTYLQALAEVAVAQADIQAAKINLGHTTITAPIDGQIGASTVSVGSLVTASQTDALATIRQINPVYVDLSESSGNLLKFRNQLKQGGFRPLIGGPESTAEVRLSFADGTDYDLSGKLESFDQFVAQATSTFVIRSRFDNPERVLLPGMYVLGTITLARNDNGFLLPQRAVSRNAKGEATARFIKEEGTAETRVIEIATDIGSNWLVTKGVSDGDRLIVSGFQNIQDGQAVKPVEVKLDAAGLEVTATDAPASGGEQTKSTGN